MNKEAFRPPAGSLFRLLASTTLPVLLLLLSSCSGARPPNPYSQKISRDLIATYPQNATNDIRGLTGECRIHVSSKGAEYVYHGIFQTELESSLSHRMVLLNDFGIVVLDMTLDAQGEIHLAKIRMSRSEKDVAYRLLYDHLNLVLLVLGQPNTSDEMIWPAPQKELPPYLLEIRHEGEQRVVSIWRKKDTGPGGLIQVLKMSEWTLELDGVLFPKMYSAKTPQNSYHSQTHMLSINVKRGGARPSDGKGAL